MEALKGVGERRSVPNTEVEDSMKRWLLILSAASVLMAGSRAMAQISYPPLDPTPYGFSFRGGVVFPFDNDLSDISSTWLGVGVDFTFTKQFIKNSETYLSADYITKNTSGQRGTFWPLLINQRFYSRRSDPDANRTYLLAGFGMAIVDVIDSDTVICGRVGLGMELSRQIFVEGSLFFSDRSTGGIITSSAGLYLGYRF